MTQATRFINQRLNSTTRQERAPGRQIVEVAYAIQGHGFIAGGAARALIMPEAPEPADIDIFCLSPEHCDPVREAVKAIGYAFEGEQGSAELYRAGFENLPVQIVPASPTLSGPRRYGTPVEVLGDFTFITEMFAVYAVGATSPLQQVYTQAAKTDTRLKRIRFNKLVSPIYATWRISKYSRKGYRISLRDVQTLFEAWQEMTTERQTAMLSASAEDPADLYRELGRL
jgi:hypothetical protein